MEERQGFEILPEHIRVLEDIRDKLEAIIDSCRTISREIQKWSEENGRHHQEMKRRILQLFEKEKI